MERHEKGSKVIVYADFTDPESNDDPVNPATVSLRVRQPDGTAADVDAGDIDHPSLGRYEYILELTSEGTYRWKWTAELGLDKKVIVPGACESLSREDF